MAKKERTWKDHLLTSSLPLEYSVLKFLDSKGALGDFEYSYLKSDENRILKEFSYDIDAAYIRKNAYIELMIECKYRHDSTFWVFLPEEYGGPSEIYPNSFMHPNDFFTVKTKFPFGGLFPIQLGPLCSRGVEILRKNENPKSIFQAITQLSYAFAEKLVDGMFHQIHRLMGSEIIFFHIPIIITTARLYRLREQTDIESIRQADSISDVADEHDILLLKNKIGVDLRNHNQSVFARFRKEQGEKLLKDNLTSFEKDTDHLFSLLSDQYCPQSIVIAHYSQDNASLIRFFDYINRLVEPDKELFDMLREQQHHIDQLSLGLQSQAKPSPKKSERPA